ncbi:liver-enriched gene 1, tandem duplicate 1 [Anguilla rostrata]|uniref:liver-enriched gene 1, tandem duplicate 1 n=1 Tax=Anguilla rostrata TaxID=7938 RepID=UPI0030D10421
MHSLVTVTVLLLQSLCINGAEVTESGYPILWDKAPGVITELPSADGAVIINPWDYLQRMSMHRLLINATEMYMSSMGLGSIENPLWGFPLQLGWKLKSGRLVDPTGATSCGQETDPMCVSPQSWWACVNYYLSVIPFLAAAETGIVGQGLQFRILAPKETAEDYCTSYSNCSSQHVEMMAKWVIFYQALKNLSTSDIPDLQKKDEILGFMWSAHLSSLLASSKCNARLEYYSAPEGSFSRYWTDSVNYVAALHFHSSIEKSKPFMSPLPSRVLREGDSPPNIPDLSAEENHTLRIFKWMDSMNKVLGGRLVQMWRKAMCSEKTREKGQALLQGLVLDPKFAVTGLLSVLLEMTTSCFANVS